MLVLAGIALSMRHARTSTVVRPRRDDGIIFVETRRSNDQVAVQTTSPEDAASRATACALASLTSTEQQLLALVLEELAVRVEARANPLSEDLT